MAKSHKHSDTAAEAPQFTLSDEIANYQLHSRLTDHVLGYYTQLGTIANLFMIATGAVWFVLAPNTFNLSSITVEVALALHIALSCIVLNIMLSMAKAIEKRREFAIKLGEKLFPSIQAIGQSTADKISKGLFRYARIGGRWTWTTIPLIGICGSLIIAIEQWPDRERQQLACEQRWDQLIQATERVQLDRARYLLDKAGCDLKSNLIKSMPATQ